MVNVSTADRERFGNGIYISRKIEGTPRYCAPESWVYKQYSCQSDVWQAGCCLYSLLSGYSPFVDEPALIIEGLYSPMDGEGWDNISDIAKDLIRKMLVVDPSKRFTTPQILSHEWLRGSAPEKKLDMNYLRRIKKLEIATQLKLVFLNKDIQKTCELQRQYLVNTLPYLFHKTCSSPHSHRKQRKSPTISKRSKGSPFHSPRYSEEIQKPNGAENPHEQKSDSLSSSFEEDLYFYQKLKLLRAGLFYAITPSTEPTPAARENIRARRYLTSENTELQCAKERSRQMQEKGVKGMDNRWKLTAKSKTDSNVLTVTRTQSQSQVIKKNGMNWDGIDLSHITYENFVLLLKKVDLSQLATREIFDIFDREQTGFSHSVIRS
jgi:serine/threonine protein kinase